MLGRHSQRLVRVLPIGPHSDQLAALDDRCEADTSFRIIFAAYATDLCASMVGLEVMTSRMF
jgi:hypothetical protein